MRKYQNFVLAISLVLMVSHVIDAAPRGRRRARRAKQNYSTTKYYSSNNRAHQQPMAASNYTVGPSVTMLPNAPQPIPNQGYVRVNAVESPSETLQQVTATSTTNAKPRTLDVGDSLPIDPSAKSSTSFAHTTYKVPVGDLQNPSVAVTSYQVQPQVQASPAVFYAAANTANAGGAIAEVNAIRTRRGLRPFIEDASLSAVAYRKASIQANRGAMGHPGGSMGGARFEGVGMGHAFTSCYLYSAGGNYAGAASVRGRNGQRYHCLLVR